MCTKYQTTQYNHYEKTLLRVKDTFSGFRIWKPSHEKQVKAIVKRVYESNSYQRLSGTYKARISGYIDACWDQISYKELFWGYEFPSGEVVDTRVYQDHPEFPGYSQTEKERYNHYWKEPRIDGTFAVY
jgi:hypothetical protein